MKPQETVYAYVANVKGAIVWSGKGVLVQDDDGFSLCFPGLLSEADQSHCQAQIVTPEPYCGWASTTCYSAEPAYTVISGPALIPGRHPSLVDGNTELQDTADDACWRLLTTPVAQLRRKEIFNG